jgi:hypothetical protein
MKYIYGIIFYILLFSKVLCAAGKSNKEGQRMLARQRKQVVALKKTNEELRNTNESLRKTNESLKKTNEALLKSTTYLLQLEQTRDAEQQGVCSAHNRAVAKATMAVLATTWMINHWAHNYVK